VTASEAKNLSFFLEQLFFYTQPGCQIFLHRTGTRAVRLHCPWPLVLIFDSFCVQGETKKSSRMHGAWRVGLIAGGNYVAVGSQPVAQGEIDNSDACVRLVM
jgi:hypothetical protein